MASTEFVNIDVRFIDAGREPTQKPNPQFPDGIDVDLRHGGIGPYCETALPYPAPRCGYIAVRCLHCGYRAMITTAGRPDDPRLAKLPCNAERLHGRG